MADKYIVSAPLDIGGPVQLAPRAVADVPVPPTGAIAIFVNSATGKLSQKTSGDVVTEIGAGSVGGTSAPDPFFPALFM